MLLELKNIKKYFPVNKNFLGKPTGVVRAVDDVSVSMAEGENLSLVGESGSGKTTLARIVIKLLAQDSGTIQLNGEDVTKVKKQKLKAFRRNVQMVFQDPYSSLDPRYSIRSVIKEAFSLDKNKFKTESAQEERISELIKAVRLKENMLNRFPHEFSGGERQRIAIARALVMNPKLLILDEAVSSLDVIIQQEVLDLLKELQGRFQLSYLFISHNLRVVRKISQRIAVMYQGKIVELAPTEGIFNNPLHPYTKELLSSALEYKSRRKEAAITLNPRAQLWDQGGGHFVLA